jgi:chromosome segregation ATPase
MFHEEIKVGADPLCNATRARAERDGQNIHTTKKQIDAENADIGTLNSGEKAVRSDLEKAEAQKAKAEAALRKQLAAKNEYQNRLQSIVTLKGEIGLASLANAEYKNCIANAATFFSDWPFQVNRNNGHFGQWSASFASQITTARELVLLLPNWIESAQERLTKLEKETEKFRVANKLD